MKAAHWWEGKVSYAAVVGLLCWALVLQPRVGAQDANSASIRLRAKWPGHRVLIEAAEFLVQKLPTLQQLPTVMLIMLQCSSSQIMHTG